MQQLQPNSLLQGGKYKIVRFISSGGFGNTYEGVHTMMDTRVAIKEFFPKMFCNRDENTSHVTVATQGNRELVDKLRKKFNEEAKAVFQMKHDNIVRVLDIFEENGTAYYVMEYIDGKSLNDISKERGALPEAEAVGYIRQVADALKYVHSLNRLHLDIKPGNIMIDKNGKAILIDFGASKHYDDESGENTSTLMGVNTKGYAPIEQSTQSFTSFSPATDIYALGATLYKLLTGIVPPDANLLLAEEETLQPLPNNISAATRNAVMAAMQLRRKDRPQAIDQFLAFFKSQNTKGITDYSLTISEEETIFDDSLSNESQANDLCESYSKELEQMAFSGNANAQKALADCYAGGKGVKEDWSNAVYWYSKAADQNNIDALGHLSECYFYGLGVEKDVSQAIKLGLKSAEQGCILGMNTISGIYSDAEDIYFDSDKAFFWNKKILETYKKQAEQGDKTSQYQLGYRYSEGIGTTKDHIKSNYWYKMAFDQYLKDGEQGDIESQRVLAIYYSEGLGGVRKDINQSLYWREQAAEQGDIVEQLSLANDYDIGLSIPKNKQKSIYWYTKAAEQGDTTSQHALAYAYDCGDGIKKDHQKALYWYTKAAEQGEPDSQIALGDNCIASDPEKANYWYRQAFDFYLKSAKEGDEHAQFELGKLYKEGKGVVKNREKAKYWLNKVVVKNGIWKDLAKLELEDFGIINTILSWL